MDKNILGVKDIQQLCGCGENRARRIIAEIKRATGDKLPNAQVYLAQYEKWRDS